MPEATHASITVFDWYTSAAMALLTSAPGAWNSLTSPAVSLVLLRDENGRHTVGMKESGVFIS